MQGNCSTNKEVNHSADELQEITLKHPCYRLSTS